MTQPHLGGPEARTGHSFSEFGQLRQDWHEAVNTRAIPNAAFNRLDSLVTNPSCTDHLGRREGNFAVI